MQRDEPPGGALRDEDRNRADIVIYTGKRPPEPETPPANQPESPATAPATQPAAQSRPADKARD